MFQIFGTLSLQCSKDSVIRQVFIPTPGNFCTNSTGTKLPVFWPQAGTGASLIVLFIHVRQVFLKKRFLYLKLAIWTMYTLTLTQKIDSLELVNKNRIVYYVLSLLCTLSWKLNWRKQTEKNH